MAAGSRQPVALNGAQEAPEVVRKPVNTLAIVPKSAKITLLGRKSYNVLLFEAQEQGLDHEVHRAPLARIIKGVDFDSNDTEVIKRHLRAMVSTTVEWQSPTRGEGSAWNVSGLLAHAKLTKESGQVWVEWSYAVNLKKELLEPTVFARLKLEVISQLRTHAAVALYEICTRYKDIARTSRQPWRWWHPVLTGVPHSASVERLEYRIFKRDTLKPAIAEVNAMTDLEVELVEHKQGRAVSEIQFSIRTKTAAATPSRGSGGPVDLGLVARAVELGVDDQKAEELLIEHGADRFGTAPQSLAERLAKAYPGPVKNKTRYLVAVLADLASAPARPTPAPAMPTPAPSASKREARWREEWLRRRREQLIAEIQSLAPEVQQSLVDDLLAQMDERGVHPSIRKRLATNGWTHPMVVQEMVRFYAQGAHGDDWDTVSPDEVLTIAAEMGDT